MEKFIKKIKILLKKNIKINSKEKISFFEQLSNLINSWIPLSNSLKIILYQTKNKNVSQMLTTIIENTNKWENFETSIRLFPWSFNEFDFAIIEMWEITGKLGYSLETIKIKEEKNQELKSKIISALIYPSIIIFLATSMIIAFMLYVIPKIEKMYKDARVNLPSLTQYIIDISNFLQKNLIILIGLFLIMFIWIKIFKKSTKTKLYYDKWILYFPIFWKIIKKKILTLFSSTLGTLLENGIIINKSLTVCGNALENEYYKKEIEKIIEWVSLGKDLSTLMGIEMIKTKKENPFFPIELSSIVKIGEQTGNLSWLLVKIWIKFDKELDRVVKNIQTAIEPVVIIWVGLVIGTIILAIMLPFFNMVNVI